MGKVLKFKRPTRVVPEPEPKQADLPFELEELEEIDPNAIATGIKEMYSEAELALIRRQLESDADGAEGAD